MSVCLWWMMIHLKAQRHYFTAMLTAVPGSTIGAAGTATATIIDDDSKPNCYPKCNPGLVWPPGELVSIWQWDSCSYVTAEVIVYDQCTIAHGSAVFCDPSCVYYCLLLQVLWSSLTRSHTQCQRGALQCWGLWELEMQIFLFQLPFQLLWELQVIDQWIVLHLHSECLLKSLTQDSCQCKYAVLLFQNL